MSLGELIECAGDITREATGTIEGIFDTPKSGPAPVVARGPAPTP